MTAHAELGASGASRWMQCPGQPAISRGLPSTSSIHALNGTAAHALAEHCLVRGIRQVPTDQWLNEPPMTDYPGILADQDMIDAVNVYLSHCSRIEDHSTRGQRWVERKVNLGPLKPHEPDHVAHSMFGTADFMAANYDRGTLYVSDYKHGSGVEVQAHNNLQLWYYGLGALLALFDKQRSRILKVVISVVQPRDGGLTPVRSQTITAGRLSDWGKNILIPAAEVADSLHGKPVEEIHNSGYLVPGDHCQFCPAAGICPAIKEQRLEKAKMTFKKEENRIVPEKDVQDLNLDELRQVLDSADDIIAWVKSAQQLAHSMLEQNTCGETDLGYKLVRKRPQRKWTNHSQDDIADWLCTEFGLGDEELFETKLRTPPQVEKAIGPAKAKKSDTWNQLVLSESSGTTLAPADDERESVKPQSAKGAFTKQDEDEDDADGLI